MSTNRKAGPPLPNGLPNVGSLLDKDEVWEVAKASFQSTLKPDEYRDLMCTKGPLDLAAFVDRTATANGSFKKSVKVLSTCISFLREQGGAIDLFAQAGGGPGCLAWGSIKMVLGMVQGYVDEYTKLIGVLTEICKWLGPVKADASTFSDSALVKQSLLGLYRCILLFWERAIVAYSPKKRQRLLRISKATWTLLDIEVESLKKSMDTELKIFITAAEAEHHRETKLGQEKMHDALTAATRATYHKEISQWLGPSNDAQYGTDFYKSDLAAHDKLRHSNTCQWFLETPEFNKWSSSKAGDRENFLWIHASPGAGKTVLASFLIKYWQKRRTVLYFFFKNDDSNKNNQIACLRSLLYQCFEYSRRNSDDSDIEERVYESAISNSKDFAVIWNLVADYLQHWSDAILIIDALDECNAAEDLVTELLRTSEQGTAKVIVTSRPNIRQTENELRKGTFISFGHNETKTDIRSYAVTETATGPLSSLQVRQQVIDTLVQKSNGMFLWVKLVLRDLCSLTSDDQFQDALNSLPNDLFETYQQILDKLNRTLPPPRKRLCHQVLEWVTCAQRALTLDELFDAVKLQYSGNVLFAQDDLATICGPLLVIQDSLVQLVHFSTREFLTAKANYARLPLYLTAFLVDEEKTNTQLALDCIKYLSTDEVIRTFPPDRSRRMLDWYTQSVHPLNNFEETLISDLDQGGSNPSLYLDLDSDPEAFHSVKSGVMIDLRQKFPFLEYATMNWVWHMADSIPVLSVMFPGGLQSFLISPKSLVWIDICLTLEPSNFDELQLSIQNLRVRLTEWIQESTVAVTSEIRQARLWATAIDALLYEYGQVLKHCPYEVHFISPASLGIPDIDDLHWQQPSLHRRSGHAILGERKYQTAEFGVERRLQRTPGSNAALGFLTYLEEEDAFLFADRLVDGDAYLYCQKRASGRQLRPLLSVDATEHGLSLECGRLREDHKYLVLVYIDFAPVNDRLATLVVWKLDSAWFSTCRSGSVWAVKTAISKMSWINADTSWAAPSFGDDEKLYWPGVVLELQTGHLREDAKVVTGLANDDPSSIHERWFERRFSFGRGGIIVIWQDLYPDSDSDSDSDSDPDSDMMYSKTVNGRTTQGQIPGAKRLVIISLDGRFLVCKSNDFSRIESIKYFLHDTVHDHTHFLCEDRVPSVKHVIACQFYLQMSRLLMIRCSSSSSVWNADIWSIDGSGEPAVILSSTVDSFDEVEGKCIHDAGCELFLVSKSRLWTRLDLKSLTWKDPRPETSKKVESNSFVSKDGTKRAVVYFEAFRLRVKVFDLQNGSIKRECTIEDGHLSFWDAGRRFERRTPAVRISPDFAMIAVHSNCFRMSREGDHQFSRPSLVSFKTHEDFSRCFWSFSPCHDYLAVLSPPANELLNPVYPLNSAVEFESKLRIFKFDSTEMVMNELSMPGLTQINKSSITLAEFLSPAAQLFVRSEIANDEYDNDAAAFGRHLHGKPGTSHSAFHLLDLASQETSCLGFGTEVRNFRCSLTAIGDRALLQTTEGFKTGDLTWLKNTPSADRRSLINGQMPSELVIGNAWIWSHDLEYRFQLQQPILDPRSSQRAYLYVSRRLNDTYTKYSKSARYPLTVIPTRLSNFQISLLLGPTPESALRLLFRPVYDLDTGYPKLPAELIILESSWRDLMEDLENRFANVEIGEWDNPKRCEEIPPKSQWK